MISSKKLDFELSALLATGYQIMPLLVHEVNFAFREFIPPFILLEALLYHLFRTLEIPLTMRDHSMHPH